MLITINDRYDLIMKVFDKVAEENGMDRCYINRIVNVVYRGWYTVMSDKNPYVSSQEEWGLFNKMMFMRFMDLGLYEEKAFTRAKGCGKRTIEVLRMVGEAMREQGV